MKATRLLGPFEETRIDKLFLSTYVPSIESNLEIVRVWFIIYLDTRASALSCLLLYTYFTCLTESLVTVFHELIWPPQNVTQVSTFCGGYLSKWKVVHISAKVSAIFVKKGLVSFLRVCWMAPPFWGKQAFHSTNLTPTTYYSKKTRCYYSKLTLLNGLIKFIHSADKYLDKTY